MVSKVMVIGMFFLGFLVFCNTGVNGRKMTLLKEEDIKIEKKLRILNKPPVKTLQIDGITFDCIEIHKQPALDHPLLINHTIQMRPSSLPKETNLKSASSTALFGSKIITEECPPGTVIIRRTRKEDLINSVHFSTFKLPIEPITSPSDLPPSTDNYHYAALQIYLTDIYGAKGSPSLYGVPGLTSKQTSATFIVLGSGQGDTFNAIHAGWGVNPDLYGDDRTHLSIVWTADGYRDIGCADMQCPGFVQVDKHITPGFVFPQLSVYNGSQFEVSIIISKDQQTGNWWLKMGVDQLPIGYWPGSLFKGLADHATTLYMGGLTHSPINVASPPMGSGHFPEEGWNKACLFAGVQYLDKSNKFQYPERTNAYFDNTTCYKLGEEFDTDQHDGLAFFFGGPGGCFR